MKHSPTPWTLHPIDGNPAPMSVNNQNGKGFDAFESVITSQRGITRICTFDAYRQRIKDSGSSFIEDDPNLMYANRNFMLHAVNMHDELIEALQIVLDTTNEEDLYSKTAEHLMDLLHKDKKFLEREAI